MLKIIFIFQAIVYLVVAPWQRGYVDFSYNPPFIWAAFAVLPLLIGAYGNRMFLADRSANVDNKSPSVSRYFPIFICLLALYYIYISLRYGLLNRRQGSEVMAEIYGNIPFFDLTLFRVFEIIFVPSLIALVFMNLSRRLKLLAATALVLSIPFMGVANSRGKILVIALSVLCFFKLYDIMLLLKKRKYYSFLLISGVALFIYMSSLRASSYSRVGDYYYNEVLVRLDGLNMLVQANDRGAIKFGGTFDLGLFGPLIAKLPFTSAGSEAKITGITSSKQYVLKYVIGTSNIDDSNSMIFDPIYFGGIVGIIISFFLIGLFLSIFVKRVEYGSIFRSRLSFSCSTAFVTSFMMIEADFIGAAVTFIQNFFIFLVFSFVFLRYKERERRPAARKTV